MKVLIWLGCVFGYSMIVAVLANGGISLGALPTIALGGGMYALAGYLCRKYEESQRNEAKSAEPEEESPASEGSVSEQETAPEAKPETPAILYCRKCGKRLIEGSDFCSYCGTPVMKG